MLVRHPDPVAVLVQWVKEFRAGNGRAPSKMDIPAELGPLYSQWIQGMRSVPLAPDKRTVARPEAPPTTKQEAPHHVTNPAPTASDAARSHISETPLKSKRYHDDFECTSRPGGGRDILVSPPSRAAAPLDRQMASPVMAKADMRRHITPKRTPSKKVVKRHKKHDFDSENDSLMCQQAPQQIQKSAFGQDAGLLSPLKSPMRNPLQSVPSLSGLLSPSNIRPGLIKRRMIFTGSMSATQKLTLQPPALQLSASIEAAASQPMQASSLAPRCSKGPQRQEPPAQASRSVQKEAQKPSAAASAAEPVKRAPDAMRSSCSTAFRVVRPPLGTTTVPEEVSVTLPEPHATSIPAMAAAVTESSIPANEKPAARPSAEDKAFRRAPKPVSKKPAAVSKLSRGSRAPLTMEGDPGSCSAEEADGSNSATSSVYSFQCSSDEDEDANSDSAAAERKPSKQQTVPQLKARLKQLGLSTAGNKKTLQERLALHMDSTACAKHSAPSAAADPLAGRSIAGPSSKVPAGKGVFKAQKRKNFVRINLKGGGTQGKFRSKHGGKPKSKRFGRFGRYKPKSLPQAGQGQDYVEGCNNKTYICYKCHQPGHWARDCPGEPADAQDPKPIKEAVSSPATGTLPRAVPAPEVLSEEAVSEEALTAALRATFGFDSFRRLQLPVIQSVLQGRNTFAIMPTGAGKSLCYQIPALLSGGLVLVVSPLIALMKDQLAHLPPGLPGAMLWSGQQASEALKTLAAIKEGKIRVLYVSPERVGSGSLRAALAPLLPLPLVCIDEAHCISEWGHNFRSAYFRLGALLREHVPSRAVLALTATATRATEASVARALGAAPECVFRDASLRGNLRLRALHVNGGTEHGSTKKALLKLLRPGGALAEAGAVIAYATFQAQAEQVAQFLTSHGIRAAAYHAGKHMKARLLASLWGPELRQAPHMERESVQAMFSKGQLRVVVATVAFGMGIDASNVRAVVHMSMPQSLEEYVQQVGRAGRDGQEAQCHLFLDDADFRRLRSLNSSDGVASSSVLAFLEAAFEAAEEATPQAEGGQEVAAQAGLGVAVLPAQELSRSLDLKAEVMETLLSYLEAHEEGYVRVLPPVGRTVKVAFYSGSCDSLAHSHAVLLSLLRVCSKPRAGTYSVQLAKWANAAGMLPAAILQELASLAKQDMLRFELDTKPTLAFQVIREPEDLEALGRELTVRHTKVSQQRLQRLDTVYRTMAQAAKGASEREQEDSIRAAVEAYFQRGEDDTEAPSNNTGLPLSEKVGFLAKDVRMLLRDTREKMSAHAVARIMHGISSVAYPAAEWRKCGYWGRYSDVEFARVLQVAEEEMQ